MTPAEQIQFERIAAAIEFLYDHHREQPDLAAVAAPNPPIKNMARVAYCVAILGFG